MTFVTLDSGAFETGATLKKLRSFLILLFEKMSARRKLSKAYRKLVSNPAAGPTKIQRKPSLTTSVCAPPKITSIDLSEKKEKIQGKIQDKIQVPTITETPTPIMPPTSNSTPRHLPPRSLTCNEISSSPPLTPPRSPAMLREQHQDLIAAQLIRNHQERLETLVTTIVVAYRTFIAPNPALQFLLLSFFGLVSLPTVAFTAFVILTTGFNTVLGGTYPTYI